MWCFFFFGPPKYSWNFHKKKVESTFQYCVYCNYQIWIPRPKSYMLKDFYSIFLSSVCRSQSQQFYSCQSILKYGCYLRHSFQKCRIHGSLSWVFCLFYFQIHALDLNETKIMIVKSWQLDPPEQRNIFGKMYDGWNCIFLADVRTCSDCLYWFFRINNFINLHDFWIQKPKIHQSQDWQSLQVHDIMTSRRADAQNEMYGTIEDTNTPSLCFLTNISHLLSFMLINSNALMCLDVRKNAKAKSLWVLESTCAMAK